MVSFLLFVCFFFFFPPFFFAPPRCEMKCWRQVVCTNTFMSVCALAFELPDNHAHMHKHADTGLQMEHRLSAGTLAPVLFQLGSYQCVWRVVIRRYNTSGSWSANHIEGRIAAIATKPSHSQQPACPWNGEWDRGGKITSPAPSDDELANPGHTLFSYSACFSRSDWISHVVPVHCKTCMTSLPDIWNNWYLVYPTWHL